VHSFSPSQKEKVTHETKHAANTVQRKILRRRLRVQVRETHILIRENSRSEMPSNVRIDEETSARARRDFFFIFSYALKTLFGRGVFLKISRARARCSWTREGNETDEKREATTRSFFSFARVSGFLRGKRGCFFIAFCPSLSLVFVKRIADENNFSLSLSLSFLSRTDTWCYRRISPSACRRTDYCRRCVALSKPSSRRRDAAILFFSLSLSLFFLFPSFCVVF
jgi:hypothetical protein